MDIAAKISQNIKLAIETSGKSKTEIAAAIGVARATVSQYISGRIQPSLGTLAKLCKFLNISADEILDLER
jgi:transcriptional regulator with XRE-family HTH domain